MPVNKKTTLEEKGSWKIYMFFNKGEFLTAVDSRNRKQAIELFKAQGFKENYCDLILSYEHRTQRYCVGGK